MLEGQWHFPASARMCLCEKKHRYYNGCLDISHYMAPEPLTDVALGCCGAVRSDVAIGCIW